MFFEDISLGTVIEIAPAVIEKEKMVAFAKEYDNVPLHTDEEYAKKTPFGKLKVTRIVRTCLKAVYIGAFCPFFFGGR